MDKYKCMLCGYVYDPEKGDPDSGINPGTSFEDIPDDWVCPVCGAGKDQFEEGLWQTAILIFLKKKKIERPAKVIKTSTEWC